MLESDLTIPERISALVRQEVETADVSRPQDLELLNAFKAALVKPFSTTVNFSGGVTQKCWTVTRPDGDYRVIYMPIAGYFSLCVESDFGPLDVGVHGPALGCFGSI